MEEGTFNLPIKVRVITFQRCKYQHPYAVCWYTVDVIQNHKNNSQDYSAENYHTMDKKKLILNYMIVFNINFYLHISLIDIISFAHIAIIYHITWIQTNLMHLTVHNHFSKYG